MELIFKIKEIIKEKLNFLFMRLQDPNENISPVQPLETKGEEQKSVVEIKTDKKEPEAKPEPKLEPKLETKPEAKEPVKEALKVSPNKPPLALVYDPQKLEKVYKHSDLEGIYRLKVGQRKSFNIWIVDGAKIRKELYTDFLFGGNNGRYKFIPEGEIWIDNAISVEELEFTIIHEVFECDLMKQGATYAKAHEAATQEELKARINKTESIDELRERWYKIQESSREKEEKK